MAANPNLSGNFGVTGVGQDLVPVTPSDSTDLAVAGRALRCKPDGAAGTVRVTTWAGVVRNTSIALGETLPLAVARVHATGTTATGLEVFI